MENKAVKKRSKNFTREETAVLVEEVEKRRAVLFGPLKGPKLTQFHRNRAWQQVTNAVNAVAPVLRTISELKSKWKDMKARTKLKANAIRREGHKTDSGEDEANTPLSAVESILVQFIGSNSIQRIAGGVDTFGSQVVNQASTSTASVEEDFVAFAPNPVANTKPAPIPKQKKKRNISAVLEEVTKTSHLQAETNQFLGELVSEVRLMRRGFEEFVNLKKRELELLEENTKKKIRIK